ncbi:MAG: hypothetical protein K2X81_08060, partial [Candidatus Obscuribacterales bacterium]|nr:hypothetical protein [Candidatus Obscuribacterales bacterium]
LYGFFEPYSRLSEKFKQSAIGTSVGSGLAITLPVLNILYNKLYKVSNLGPPTFLSAVLDGKPVDGSTLPPLVVRYLDSPVPGAGSEKKRREILNTLWNERYHADMSKPETLCGIADGKSKKPFVLQSRIVLLWSLRTAVEGFNKDLLALSNQARGSQFTEEPSLNSGVSTSSGLSGGAAEAAALLHLEPVVAELNSLGASAGNSERKRELQITLLETLLSGFLDMRVASDRCQQDLNYQYDVVLSQMMARRGRFLQKTYETNFIQTGTLGACAGWSYLNGYSKAGNQLFIISDAIGLGITTISLLGTHGGWRRNRSEPNSLADFFDLRAKGKHGFSPLVWNYLNSSSPKRTDGKSRRQYLHEVWAKHKVSNINLKEPRNLEKLGSMPSCKWDTIKLVDNRIALLSSLREQFEQFDQELLDLLRKTWPESIASTSADVHLSLSPTVNAAANLLGVQVLMATSAPQQLDESSKLLITRNVMEAFFDANANSNILGHEILLESQIRDRMNRQRDMAIQLTNVANFYQLGILGIVSDSMGLSSKSNYVLYADRINIVSGYLIASLALTSVLEGRGGFRPGKAQPNALSAAFGKQSDYVKLSPLMVRYLNSVSPISQTSLSRREELVKYWKEAKVLNVNVGRNSVVEKLSAEGKAHHWWSETTKLISNRITMLYDLRAVLRTSTVGFDELIKSLD